MRFLAVLFCLISATPGIAQTAPAAKPEPEKKICKRQQITGSNFTTRECHTKAEWDAMAENARSAVMRQRSAFNRPGEN